MTIKTKVQGTKYNLEISLDISSDIWEMALVIDGKKEEKVKFDNKSLNTIENSVLDILSRTSLQVNDFQKELMSKDLYKQLSGDEDLTEHNQAMKEYEEKKDPDIQASVVNEFKSAFKVKEEQVPPNRKEKMQKKEEKKEKAENKEEGSPPSPDQETQQMMSEITREFKGAEKTEEGKPAPAHNVQRSLHQQVDPVDTRVTSSDVDDLVNELKETKELLMSDLDRVYKRMEKMDKLILKISSISNKL